VDRRAALASALVIAVANALLRGATVLLTLRNIYCYGAIELNPLAYALGLEPFLALAFALVVSVPTLAALLAARLRGLASAMLEWLALFVTAFNTFNFVWDLALWTSEIDFFSLYHRLSTASSAAIGIVSVMLKTYVLRGRA